MIEDRFHLARVCNYIHLNPVRAGVMPAARVGDFRWSSLASWLAGAAPRWLDSTAVLAEASFADELTSWARYVQHLERVASERTDDPRTLTGGFSGGWAIGSLGLAPCDGAGA